MPEECRPAALKRARWNKHCLQTSQKLDTNFGWRHVQVARSFNHGKTWKPFELLQFDDFTLAQDHNIYLFTTRALELQKNGAPPLPPSPPPSPPPPNRGHRHAQTRADEDAGTVDTRRVILLGLYPAVFGDIGGIFGSVSRDGLRWSRPMKVLDSKVVNKVRTQDHPVELVGRHPMPIDADRPNITIAVHHDVDFTENLHCRQNSTILRYTLELGPLLALLPPLPVAANPRPARRDQSGRRRRLPNPNPEQSGRRRRL